MYSKKQICDFEKEVFANLTNFGFLLDERQLGVAVSGGADSVSLLISLIHLFSSKKIYAITINHNIRKAEETEGDALFVEALCKTHNVDYFRYDIPRGEVFSYADKNDCGIEAAARDLRYNVFKTIYIEKKLSGICLAHNKNDQIETILMRFFSGGSVDSLSGISGKRDFYFRPLLSISRDRIESYLSSQKIQWRTDSTNEDTAFFRNRIRKRIIPFLNSEIPGWQNAILNLSLKNSSDSEVLECITQKSLLELDFLLSKEEVSFLEEKFFLLPKAIRRRIIYKAADALLIKGRLPFTFVDSVCEKKIVGTKEACGIEIFCKETRVFVRKKIIMATESGFSVIIERNGAVETEFANFSVTYFENFSEMGNGMFFETIISGEKKELFVPKLQFPFILRNYQIADTVLSSNGTEKSVSKIFESWKCGKNRALIPVIQEMHSPLGQIVCLWGSLFGFPNWIVKENS